jgi:hypothetical protein
MNHDVFISYSRRDTPIADQICAAFDRAGISYFIDRQGIGGGVEFPKVLAPAIKNCKVFLLLASENSYNSSFTRREITYAFKKKNGENMLPYIIDGCEMPDDIDFIFSSTNWRTSFDYPIDPVLVDDILQLLGRGEECSFNRKAKEEADRKAKEEADRKAKEEADRKAKEEADRKAKEEDDRKANEEVDCKTKEEAERKAKGKAAGKGSAKGKAKEDDKYVVIGTGKMVLEKEDVPRDATHIRIAEGIKTINYSAFEGCNSLVSVIIPKGVTEIKGHAFSECESLMSVVIPHGVTEIGGFAFYKCINLTSVVIPEGVTVIHWGTFSNCHLLSTVVIPESVKEIGKQAFVFCDSLKTVRLLNPNTKYKKHSLLGAYNTFDDHTEIIKGKI